MFLHNHGACASFPARLEAEIDAGHTRGYYAVLCCPPSFHALDYSIYNINGYFYSVSILEYSYSSYHSPWTRTHFRSCLIQRLPFIELVQAYP